MAFVFFDSWIRYRAQLGFLPDIELVDRTQYKVLLSSNAAVTAGQNIVGLLPLEITDDGYERIPVVWGSGDEGTYDSTTRTQTLAEKQITVSGEVSFSSVVLLANCPDTQPRIGIQSVSFTNDTITTIAAHNRISGDPIMLSFDDTYPAPTDGNTLYYADPTSTTELRLQSTPTGGLIDITANGAGAGSVRFASGIPVGYTIASATTFVPSGQSVPITLSIGAKQ